MNTYTIYLNDLINQPASMVWDETCEEVAFFDPEQEIGD